MSTNNQEIKVTDYHIFEDAYDDSNSLHTTLDEEKSNVLTAKGVICSDDVFMGPIAESCFSALETLADRMEIAIENFSSICDYFKEVAEAYKKGDEKASKLILSKDDDGKLITKLSGGLVGDTNEEKIFNYLKDKGLTDAEACGIMACMYFESRFLPEAESTRPGDESLGICQWLAERRTSLENYCSANGKDPTDLEAQLDFLFYECETTNYKVAMDRLTSITGESEDAAAASADRWLIDYEGVGRSFKSYSYHTSVRQQKARELYNKYHK